MFFETCIEPYPQVSAPLEKVAELFISGRAKEAGELLKTRLSECTAAEMEAALPGDYVLQIELLRAEGRHSRSFALGRLAARRFPDDPALQVYKLRSLLGAGRILEGIRYLEVEAVQLKERHPAIHAAELASIKADAGLEKSADEMLRRVGELRAQESEDCVVTTYLVACANGGMRRWDESIAHGRRAVELSPRWMRARTRLLFDLLAVGNQEEANQLIRETEVLQSEDANLEFYRLFAEITRSGLISVKAELLEYLERWPGCEFIPPIKRCLFVIAAETGDEDLLNDLMADQTDSIREKRIEDVPTGSSSSLVSLPFIAQKRDECVATTVAMIAHAQGMEFDPSRIYREMKGRQGIPLWRMRDWVLEKGFRFVCVELTMDNIAPVLDLGIPILGLVEGFMMSHVDVICGHNRDLGLVYVRDPMSWMTIPMTIEETMQKHVTSPAVYLILTEANYRQHRDVIDSLAPCPEGEALIDLSKACLLGQRGEAEAAFARIPQGHLAEFSAVGYGNKVVMSPTQADEAYDRISKDNAIPLPVRFNALTVRSGGDTADAIDELLESGDLDLAPSGEKILHLMKARSQGDSDRALQICEKLLGGRMQSAFLWATRAGLLMDVGRLSEAIDSLETAIEMEPLNVNSQELMLRLNGMKTLPESELQELEKLVESDSDNKALLWMIAEALLNGPDGLAYEKAVHEYLQFFPRDPAAWYRLWEWYLYQGNHERVEATVASVKELLPGDPLLDMMVPPEGGDSERKEGAESRPELLFGDALKAKEEEETELPDGVPDLLNIYSKGEHPLRAEAFEALKDRRCQGALQWHEEGTFRAIYLSTDYSNSEGEPDRFALSAPSEGVRHQMARQVVQLNTDSFPVSAATATAIYEWMQKTAPGYKSESEFWFNAVLLLEARGRIEEALVELENLLKEFPGCSSAVFRLGMIRFQQGRKDEAVGLFQRCLEIDPGLPGALNGLIELGTQLDRKDLVTDARERMITRWPYHYAHIQDYLADVFRNHGMDEALSKLESIESRFGGDYPAYFRINLELDAENQVKAGKLVKGLEPPENDIVFEDYLSCRLRWAFVSDIEQEIHDACDAGLKRWPKSANLLKLKGQQFAASASFDNAETFFKKAIFTGEPDPQTYFFLLSVVPDPLVTTKECIEQVEESMQPPLIANFLTVYQHPQFSPQRAQFLKWASKRFPSNVGIQEGYINHHVAGGNPRRAVKLARKLVDTFPVDPYFQFLLGRVLVDSAPREAKTYLEKAYEENQSTDVMFNLARCHQVLGQKKASGRMHWEILEKDPLFSASVTNLFFLNESPAKLWPLVNPILRSGCNYEDEYFCVATVKLAKLTGNVLDDSWIDAATDRYNILQTRPGFQDEHSRLKKAIKAWLTVNPAFDHPLNGGMKWFYKMSWPGLKWIPGHE